MLDTQVLLDSPARLATVLPAPFACSWTHDGNDAAWVLLAGELDLATSARFDQTLQNAQERARMVVVDLRQLAFADSSALLALVEANARARRRGGRLVILRGPPQVDRIFTLSRVCETVEIVDLEAAEPPVTATRRLAAERRDLGSVDVGDRLRRAG